MTAACRYQGVLVGRTVCYHFLCPAHGLVTSTPIDGRLSPRARSCVACGQELEVWVGANVVPPLVSARDVIAELQPAG
jgi:hypothetical protein